MIVARAPWRTNLRARWLFLRGKRMRNNQEGPGNTSSDKAAPVELFLHVRELAKESRDGGNEPTIGRLENDGCGRPLAERGIDAPGMEDERDAAVEELPADERAVGIAEIEIQNTCRDVWVPGQTQRLV